MKKLSTSVICVCLFFSLVGVSLESGAFDENAVGYKDIKIGQTIGYLESQGICKHFGLQSYHCYDSEWTFNIYGTGTNQTTYKTHGRVTRLDIRVGVYGKESHNKFRGLLKKKYDTVYNFGDIDIERFNNDEIDAMYDVYEEGQVALTIQRIGDNNYTVISYRNESLAKELLKQVIPKKIKSDDF